MLSKAQFCLWKHWHLPKRRQDLVFSWHYLVLVPGPGRTGNGQKTEWWRQPPFAQKTWVNENKSKGFTVREIRIWLFSVCSLEIQRISKIHLFLKRKKKSNSLSLNHLRNFFMGLLNKFPPLPVITFFHFFASEVSNFFQKVSIIFFILQMRKAKLKDLLLVIQNCRAEIQIEICLLNYFIVISCLCDSLPHRAVNLHYKPDVC